MKWINEVTGLPRVWIVICFILCAAILLLLSVLAFSSPAFCSAFALSDKKGEIGDAVNGMTAPISALIAAGLIFYSLMAQVHANKMQFKAGEELQIQWEYDNIGRFFNEIQNSYSNIKYTTRGMSYSGAEALEEFIRNIDDHNGQQTIAVLQDLSFVLEELHAFIGNVNRSKIHKIQKAELLRRINRFYITKVEVPLVHIENGISRLNHEFTYEKSTIDQIRNTIEAMRRWLTTPSTAT